MPANHPEHDMPPAGNLPLQVAHAESTLLDAIEHAADGIFLADTAGKVLWANRACTARSGYTVAEMAGLPGLWNSGWEEPAFLPNLWRTILSGRSWSGHTRSRRKDGSACLEETTIAPLRDSGGAISYFLSIQQEVPET